MEKWYRKTMIRVVQMLGSDMNSGLTEEKIKYMRETYGENIIVKPKVESLLSLIVNEIKQLWILVLLVYIVMLVYNKQEIMACVITLITITSVVLLINGDYKEEKALMAIDNLNTPFSMVMRSGKICKVNCEEMVVGDIVFLEKGDYVPADIRILEYENLKVVEVAVTGERYEVEKYSMKIEGEVINLSDIKNIVFKSSVITEGSGLGIVIATGMNTQLGEIIKVLLEYKSDNSFFSKSVTKIANKISMITIIAGISTLCVTLYKKNEIHEIINALIYVFMPFSLPIFIIIIFLFFNIVFAEFKKKNIFIKNISTIYVLTNISTIFTKKIGVISENELILREVYCDNILIDVQNNDLKIEDTIERILSIALLCNDAKVSRGDPNSIESLAESSILKFYNEELTEKGKLDTYERRIFKVPYDSDKRLKTVVNKIEGRYRANVKGVLDSLINRCTHILINGVEIEIKEDDIINIINIHINMSNSAYSVIAYGYRNFNYEPSIDENIESNLVFVGLMGFENPIKESSYVAMKTCNEINIRPIIDEEDNKLASLAFGKLIGLTQRKEEIISGIEIDYMSKEEFEKNIEAVSIFSKITPKHKNDIVNSLNSKGYSIASVGDTLTDLEYLKNSNISISAGNECSNLVRKLSSLFLQENDFGEIINLIQHSKKIVNYINELVLFLVTTGISEIFIILISLIIGDVMAFTFIGVLYLNFIVAPCCGFSILLQNRDTHKGLRDIDYKYIKRVATKSSFIIGVIYVVTFALIHRFSINRVQGISVIIFALYQNIFGLKLIYEKSILKNKISYTLFVVNSIVQCIFIIYLLTLN